MGWEDAILRTFSSFGGRASLQDVYERIPKFITLSADHLRETKWGGRPAYQHQVRSYVSKMAREGALRKVAHGVYIVVWA